MDMPAPVEAGNTNHAHFDIWRGHCERVTVRLVIRSVMSWMEEKRERLTRNPPTAIS